MKLFDRGFGGFLLDLGFFFSVDVLRVFFNFCLFVCGWAWRGSLGLLGFLVSNSLSAAGHTVCRAAPA